MKEQNFSNHARFVPLYHYVGALLLLAILIGSVINLATATRENLYSASLITALTLAAILVGYFARAFALKAQDRAIRAEENFRHFVLTGKPLDKHLNLGQVIALRFADDEELPSLVQRAVAENLNNRQIKKLISAWKADHHRV